MGFWEAFGFFKNGSCLPLTIPAHSPPPGESPKPYFPPTAFPVPRRPCFPARNAFPHTVWPAGSGAEPRSTEPAFQRNCCGHARRGCAQAGALGSAFACVQAARPSQRCLPGCWAARRAHGGRISGAAWGGVELQHQLLLQVNLHWVPAPITGLEGGASPRPLSSVLGGRSAGSAWFGADHNRSSGR